MLFQCWSVLETDDWHGEVFYPPEMRKKRKRYMLRL